MQRHQKESSMEPPPSFQREKQKERQVQALQENGATYAGLKTQAGGSRFWVLTTVCLVFICVLLVTIILCSNSTGQRGLKVKSDLRIIVVGKTGAGKSASGNTILGEKVFEEKLSSESVTNTCQKHQRKVEGGSISVIDTPGMFGTKINEAQLKDEIEKCVEISVPGPHAFLLVIRLDMRFTDEENKTMKWIQENFGEKAANYSIILFTRGDQIDKPIEEFMNESREVKELVKQCKSRYHVFNNKDKNPSQVYELLDKIETMVMENGHYTYKMYKEKPDRNRQKKMKMEAPERSEEDENMHEGAAEKSEKDENVPEGASEESEKDENVHEGAEEESEKDENMPEGAAEKSEKGENVHEGAEEKSEKDENVHKGAEEKSEKDENVHEGAAEKSEKDENVHEGAAEKSEKDENVHEGAEEKSEKDENVHEGAEEKSEKDENVPEGAAEKSEKDENVPEGAEEKSEKDENVPEGAKEHMLYLVVVIVAVVYFSCKQRWM